MIRRPPISTRTVTLFPYTTLFRSVIRVVGPRAAAGLIARHDFQIATAQDDADVEPRVIMQRAIVIAARDVMQVSIEQRIARDQPPAAQVRRALLGVGPDGEVRSAL